MVARHGAPGDWVISVFDANGLRVARSRAHEESLAGGRPHQPCAPSSQSRSARDSARRLTLRANESTRPTAESSRKRLAGGPRDPHGRGRSCRLPVADDLWRQHPALDRARIARGLVGRPKHHAPDGDAGLAVLPRRSAAARRRSRRTHPFRRFATSPPRSSPPPRRRTGVEVDREALLCKEQEARAAAEAADRAKDEFLAHRVARAPHSAQLGARVDADASGGQLPGEADVRGRWRSSNATRSRRSRTG